MNYNIEDYIDERGNSLTPCPYCGGEVEFRTSRDLCVLRTQANCSKCEGSFCGIETAAFVKRHSFDILGVSPTELVAVEFCNWATEFNGSIEKHHYPDWW